ncbi:hypothetical protein P8452_09679 [Trifolium repens]|nr:hypothetical protein P8452_09679 [Trifolium repens]
MCTKDLKVRGDIEGGCRSPIAGRRSPSISRRSPSRNRRVVLQEKQQLQIIVESKDCFNLTKENYNEKEDYFNSKLVHKSGSFERHWTFLKDFKNHTSFWQLVFVNRENDIILLDDDDPWHLHKDLGGLTIWDLI